LAILSEAFGEGIVVNLQLCDLIVLVSRDPQKSRFRIDKCVVGRKLQLHQIIGLDHVDSGHVLVHGGQNDMAVLVEVIVRQLDFLERNVMFHPL
jgi:hypothetical protein